jgi:hypothetical protein
MVYLNERAILDMLIEDVGKLEKRAMSWDDVEVVSLRFETLDAFNQR